MSDELSKEGQLFADYHEAVLRLCAGARGAALAFRDVAKASNAADELDRRICAVLASYDAVNALLGVEPIMPRIFNGAYKDQK